MTKQNLCPSIQLYKNICIFGTKFNPKIFGEYEWSKVTHIFNILNILNSVEFLYVPDTYYDDLLERVGDIDEDVEEDIIVIKEKSNGKEDKRIIMLYKL